jgi:hypothetical protein
MYLKKVTSANTRLFFPGSTTSAMPADRIWFGSSTVSMSWLCIRTILYQLCGNIQSGQKTKLHVLCYTKRSKAPRYCITDQISMKFNASQQEFIFHANFLVFLESTNKKWTSGQKTRGNAALTCAISAPMQKKPSVMHGFWPLSISRYLKSSNCTYLA